MAAPHKRLIMAVKGGPDIITEGLVFHLDAAARNKSYPVNGLDVEYLVVAGGGGSAKFRSGGGGAGGLLHGYTTLTTSVGTYPIVIGGGGTHNASSVYTIGSNGSNTTFNDLEAIGGGAGSYYIGWASSGGSGGGNSHYCCGIPIAIGVPGQGHDGGLGRWWGQSSAGGGGAGEAGYIAGNAGQKAGKGGDGLPFNIEGYTKYYAGGGAGGTHRYNDASTWSLDNVGGLGGGGDSGQPSPVPNSGGGSGGSTHWNSLPSNGSSGIVVIRYKGPKKATGGDSVYTSRGYTVHVFTSSGTFTVGDRVGGLSTNKIVGSLENMGSNDYKTGNKGYFSFDGSNQAIKLPNFDVSTLGGNFTICSLIKPIGSISHVFSSVDVIPSSQTKNITFYFQETASYGISSNAMRLQFGKDIWAWQVYGSNGLSLLKNNWYFVAVTAANLNTNTHTIKFYVNDQSVNATKWQFGSPTPINYGGDISNSTFLARSHSASDPTYINTYYEINIANVKIYNKTLSDNEVLDNYNATKGRYGL
jgi:hypothetical protein